MLLKSIEETIDDAGVEIVETPAKSLVQSTPETGEKAPAFVKKALAKCMSKPPIPSEQAGGKKN